MRFLLDNNLSPALVELLSDAGHDAVHLRPYGMQSAPDIHVLERARDERRFLVSADTDFGALLARHRLHVPSVILIRRITDRRAEAIARLLCCERWPGCRRP